MAPKSSRTPKKAREQSIATMDPRSSLAPEMLEELKVLAAKAKTETWGKWIVEQAWTYMRSITLLALAAIFCNASQLALSPVYGSIPSSIWHNKVVMAACFTGWSSNLFLNRNLPFKPQLLLPLIAIYVPTVQFFLGRLSSVFTAHWGPLITEVLTLFPLVGLSVACVATTLEDADLSALPSWIAEAGPGLGSYGFFKAVETLSNHLIQHSMGSNIFNTRLGWELVLAGTYSAVAPSKLLLFAVPALLHTALLNIHMPTSTALAALNNTLRSDGWLILDRRESLTGYISVVESSTEGFRVMRCDHSLLGGEWIVPVGAGQYKHNQVAEPVFGVFAMLEAVRLVEVPSPVSDREAKALVIGLGIGTTPAAFLAHGIDTTVVEIDPVVYEFALKYFQLPSKYTQIIEDAVSYTSKLVNDSSTRFDYIVHDVFTGGAEPIPLFTLEFLQSLHTLLTPNGVIAINYAGDFALPPPSIIVRTIRRVFPSCRIFREYPRDEAELERDGRDFTNMVIFCMKQRGSQMTFRAPTARDYLNSPTREEFLIPKHEVIDSHFLADGDDQILTSNDTQKLVQWHEKNALGHWGVMRMVIPTIVWENW